MSTPKVSYHKIPTTPPTWRIFMYNGPGDGFHRCYAYETPEGKTIVCRDREAAIELQDKNDGNGKIQSLKVHGC